MTDADDYYTVLGIQRDATEEAIHQAYFALARQYHPDVNPEDPESAKKFIKLQAAFEVLTDPVARASYNRTRISYATVRAAKCTVAEKPSTSIGWKFIYVRPRRWVRDPCALDWVSAPAICLLLLAIFWIPFYLYSSSQRYEEIMKYFKTGFPHQTSSPEELNAELDQIHVLCIVHTALSVVVVLGALSMLTLWSLPLAVAGAIAASIPCVGPGYGFGIFVGGWALTSLYEARDAFRY
jgi:curved DNA-binding protein CbpA